MSEPNCLRCKHADFDTRDDGGYSYTRRDITYFECLRCHLEDHDLVSPAALWSVSQTAKTCPDYEVQAVEVSRTGWTVRVTKQEVELHEHDSGREFIVSRERWADLTAAVLGAIRQFDSASAALNFEADDE